jgi:sec-independent protein translocase protein TatA
MSAMHWVVVAVVALVLFGGRGKIPDLMGDLAKGIKSFKNGMKDEDAAEVTPVRTIPANETTKV